MNFAARFERAARKLSAKVPIDFRARRMQAAVLISGVASLHMLPWAIASTHRPDTIAIECRWKRQSVCLPKTQR